MYVHYLRYFVTKETPAEQLHSRFSLYIFLLALQWVFLSKERASLRLSVCTVLEVQSDPLNWRTFGTRGLLLANHTN